MSKKIKDKILILDIETLPAEALVFDLWTPVNVDFITEHPTILCIQYKWLGDKGVKVFSVLDGKEFDVGTMRTKKTPKIITHQRNDFFLSMQIGKILKEADMIVTKNGKKFDMKWINARRSIHGLSPLPPVPHFDIEEKVKGKYKFISRKLSYLAKIYGITEKLKTDIRWWVGASKGIVTDIKNIIHYGKGDIHTTEELFLKIRADFPALLNKNIDSLHRCCPSCGSKNLKSEGFRVNSTGKYRRLHCMSCGHWSQERASSIKIKPEIK